MPGVIDTTNIFVHAMGEFLWYALAGQKRQSVSPDTLCLIEEYYFLINHIVAFLATAFFSETAIL